VAILWEAANEVVEWVYVVEAGESLKCGGM